MLVFHMVMIQDSAASLLIQLPVDAYGEVTEDGPSFLRPCTHVAEKTNWTLGEHWILERVLASGWRGRLDNWMRSAGFKHLQHPWRWLAFLSASCAGMNVFPFDWGCGMSWDGLWKGWCLLGPGSTSSVNKTKVPWVQFLAPFPIFSRSSLNLWHLYVSKAINFPELWFSALSNRIEILMVLEGY